MRRLLILPIVAFLSGLAVCASAESQPETPNTLRAAPQAAPLTLGRLFFSPEERGMLDQLRQKSGGSTLSPSEQITLNGLVRRSNGKTTVWINQVPQRENEKQSVTVLKSTAKSPTVPLQLPSGKQVILKPGQTFDATRGTIREGYEYPAALPAKAAE